MLLIAALYIEKGFGFSENPEPFCKDGLLFSAFSGRIRKDFLERRPQEGGAAVPGMERNRI